MIKTNIGTLLEVTDSIWIIVKQNINVLVTFVGALFSLLLGGGHAVITFLIDAVSLAFRLILFQNHEMVSLLLIFPDYLYDRSVLPAQQQR